MESVQIEAIMRQIGIDEIHDEQGLLLNYRGTPLGYVEKSDVYGTVYVGRLSEQYVYPQYRIIKRDDKIRQPWNLKATMPRFPRSKTFRQEAEDTVENINNELREIFMNKAQQILNENVRATAANMKTRRRLTDDEIKEIINKYVETPNFDLNKYIRNTQQDDDKIKAMLYRRLGMKDYDSPRMVETQLDNTIKDENETLERKIERNQMRIEGEAVKEATNYRDGGGKHKLRKRRTKKHSKTHRKKHKKSHKKCNKCKRGCTCKKTCKCKRKCNCKCKPRRHKKHSRRMR